MNTVPTGRSKASERTLALRRLLTDLHRLTRDIKDINTTEAVGIGTELYRIIYRAQHILEPIKTRVRDAAAPEANGPGRVHLQGPDGTTCDVVFQEPLPKLRKDAELQKLRVILGDHFGDLFTERLDVQPRKGFKDLVITDLDDVQAKAVLDAVDLISGAPRVSFSNNK